MKTRPLINTVVAVVVPIFTACLSTCLGQGSLTPPGAPGPTMITLSQVEPRTPISSVPYTIYPAGSGSYYLTGNLLVPNNTNGITVEASEVTIDLNGFAILGGSGVNTAIMVSGAQKNITVRNGTINYFQTAIQGTNAGGSLYENVQCYNIFINGLCIGGNSVIRNCNVIDPAVSGGGNGIQTGDGSQVSDCAVLDDFNHYSTGIVVGRGCEIDSSISTSNYVGVITGDGTKLKGCSFLGNISYGLESGSGCILSDCTACGNAPASLYFPAITTGEGCTITGCTADENSEGISAGLGSTVKDCTVISNNATGLIAGNGCTISGCTANYNNTNGIVAASECTISGCTASANGGDGIQAAYSCLISGNTCSSNSRYVVTGGAGIHVLYSGNRIEDNVLNSDEYGLKVDGTENLVIRNAARNAGSDNYDIVSDNMVDTIIYATATSSAITGPTGGTSLGTTDPWANFSY